MNALDDILAGVRDDLAVRQSHVPLERLKERCQHIDAAIALLSARGTAESHIYFDRFTTSAG